VSEARLVVDLASGVAPWRQIRDQLVRLIVDRTLPVGSRLPPIRQVATDLGLAPGTVARAYRELEANGVVRTARRRGTVVVAVPVAPSAAADPPSAVATLPTADPSAVTPSRPTDRPGGLGASGDNAQKATAARRDTAIAGLAAEYVAQATALGESPGAIIDAVRTTVLARPGRDITELARETFASPGTHHSRRTESLTRKA